MKPRTQILLVLAGLLGVVGLSALRREANPGRSHCSGVCGPLMAAVDAWRLTSATNAPITNAPTPQVIAYYFYGTVRCETCLLTEVLAKAVIEQQFSVELAANRLRFASVNYDLPENAHFLTDYKLPCPLLVLVRKTEGHAEEWKQLGDTWQRVHDPPKLNNYVESEVKKFLSGQAQQVITNNVELPPAPEHR